MIGIENCVYKTPCGWCSKWDKECDKKIHKPNESINDFSTLAVKKCASEFDHEWECIGLSTDGTDYRCKKCGAHRRIPCVDISPQPLYANATFTLNTIPNCCKACPNHPSNGGSGFCNCTLPYFEQSLTCPTTSNTTKLD